MSAELYSTSNAFVTKNEDIISELDPFIESITQKLKDEPKAVSKSINLPSQTRNKLICILRRYRPLNASMAYKMSSDEVWEIYNNYLDLIQHINEYFAYQADKLEFCAYVGITASFFEEQVNDTSLSGDDNVLTLHDIFVTINDDMVQMSLSGGETGVLSEKAAQLRTKAKKFGNNVSETSDLNAMAEQAVEAFSKASYVSRLEAIAKTKPKILEENN